MPEPVSARAVRWLHISDFHLKAVDSYDQDVVLGALTSSLPNLIARFGRPDFVVASGDIAYSGKKEEYALASPLFDQILEKTECDKSRLLVVPGNHDIDRKRGIGLARTLASLHDADLYFAPGNENIHAQQRLVEYKSWYNSYFENIRTFNPNSTFELIRLTFQDVDVCVCAFNSASFCLDESDSGKLFLGRQQVANAVKALDAGSFLNLAVMHHPFPWLSAIEIMQVKTAIHDAFDAVLTGHLHETDVESVSGTAGSCLHLVAGAAYQGSRWPNTAMFCEFDGKSIRVTPIRYSDTPRPSWSLDTSVFPGADTYQQSYCIRETEAVTDPSPAPPTASTFPVQKAMDSIAVATVHTAETAAALEDRLFVSVSGAAIYTEPRLMRRSQIAALDEDETECVSTDHIVDSSGSYFIEAKSEYGGSTLCRVLHHKLALAGHRAAFRNSRDIPNYKKKLEVEFAAQLSDGGGKFTLILDDFDYERDDRLIRELHEAGWLDRVIIVSVNRRLTETIAVDVESMPFSPAPLHLWALGRNEIRTIANKILSPNDQISEAKAVDKVYTDLLALRIPLSPSNVIMYLKVLQREGDFEPLSRVDILSRYLAESLRKPSDVLGDSFNFKNKLDVLSAFSYQLNSDRLSDFDERYWLNFCKNHQAATLREFNDKQFLSELVESRILAQYTGGYYFRYSFYFTFLYGRYLWPRPALIAKLFESDEYLANSGVIDVITGLSSENSELVANLTARLQSHLNEFADKYVRADFDPLRTAQWPQNQDEDAELWAPVQKAIEAGPADCKEIDDVKSSMLAEARTADQQVTFEKFAQLENALFAEGTMLQDALKNADDVSGPIKMDAWRTLLASMQVVVQVGTMFAPALSKRKRFNWGGVSFLDFDRAAVGHEEGSKEASIAVIISLVDAAVLQISQEAGANKLAPVFKALAVSKELSGFQEVANFACVVASRGRDWFDVATASIERMDKSAFYLRMMLDFLMTTLRLEIMSGGDRAGVKRLVALIQAKRNFGKQSPGAKAVSKIERFLEADDYFPNPSKTDGSRPDAEAPASTDDQPS